MAAYTVIDAVEVSTTGDNGAEIRLSIGKGAFQPKTQDEQRIIDSLIGSGFATETTDTKSKPAPAAEDKE